MPVDRKLLWKAWPDGALAMLGVSTVAGWLWDGFRWRRCSKNAVGSYLRQGTPEPGELRSGDLLPNVDPTDVATWACLLDDLARASARLGSAERYDRTWSNTDEGWRLFWQHRENSNITGTAFYLIDTDDAAEALVRARIQVRDEGTE